MPVWCAETVAICSVRGAYEYAGQKCSATARMYVPESLWPEVSGGGGREEGREGGITVHHTHTSLLVKCPFFLPVSMGDL